MLLAVAGPRDALKSHEANPKDVSNVVLDTSGSMAGKNLRAGEEGAQLAYVRENLKGQ